LLNSLFPKTGALLAIAVSSVAFSLLHVDNAAVTPIALVNIALFGVFAGIYFLRRGSIWGIAALHSAWNFAEGNIFGVRVSGALPQASMFTATADGSMWLLSGGDFGAEGGLAVTAVLAIATIAVYCIPITHKK
jgi:membrane protease YdiL (CAAX protease family)